MKNEYLISITNGLGKENVLSGKYDVYAYSTGYKISGIYPYEIDITDNKNNYDFIMIANGVLWIRVTEDGTEDGFPVQNATFYRCDKDGNTYGDSKSSSSTGLLSLPYLPFDKDNPPSIYFRQTSSDGTHAFDPSIKEIKLSNNEQTIFIKNGPGPTRFFEIEDLNYPDVNIDDGYIKLTNEEKEEFYITIKNKKGDADLKDGVYKIRSYLAGYYSTEEDITITSDNFKYKITVEASGVLSLIVTDDGTYDGERINGATFYRCNYNGDIISEAYITNSQGITSLQNVPHDIDYPPYIYIKQTSSDGKHSFSYDVKSFKMIAPNIGFLIENPIINEK